MNGEALGYAVNGEQDAGMHETVWKPAGSTLASGIYAVVLDVKNHNGVIVFSDMKKAAVRK